MREVKYKFMSDTPYSLHDMNIRKIIINDDSITFIMKDGFEEKKEPYNIVKGQIIFENVDFDFCCITLLSNFGQYGEFIGKKITFQDFLMEYPEYNFEIVDELYGYNQVIYGGYLTLPNDEIIYEMEINIYHFGEILYQSL